MNIDALIKELQRVKEKHGNIEVTCVHASEALANDSSKDKFLNDCFRNKPHETTVENLIVRDGGIFGKRVRVSF